MLSNHLQRVLDKGAYSHFTDEGQGQRSVVECSSSIQEAPALFKKKNQANKTLLECLSGESKLPRDPPILGRDLTASLNTQARQQGSYPLKNLSFSCPRLGCSASLSSPLQRQLMVSESTSSCNQVIGRPQRMEGKLSKTFGFFFISTGRSLCLRYLIAVWTQLTRLTHHKL